MRRARSQSGSKRRHGGKEAFGRVVFRLNRPYAASSMAARSRACSRTRAGHGLYHRAYHRSAPEPGAAPRLRRLPAQALHGLRQLEARARAPQRHGDAGAPRWGFARAASRPRRDDRRSRQYWHAGGVPPRRGLDEDARRSARRQFRSRQSRRLCARFDGHAERHVRAMDHERFGHVGLSLFKGARRDCDHRPDLGRADRTPDGDGPSRPQAACRLRGAARRDRRPRRSPASFSSIIRRSRKARRRSAASPTRRRSSAWCASAAPRQSSTGIPTNSSSARCPRPPRAPSAEGSPCSAPPRPPPQPTTPTAAPPIISSGSTAKPASGASAPGSADWRSAGSISASARRWRCEDESVAVRARCDRAERRRRAGRDGPGFSKSCRSPARRTARRSSRNETIFPVIPW